MITGPPPKFHELRDILRSLGLDPLPRFFYRLGIAQALCVPEVNVEWFKSTYGITGATAR